MPFSGLRRRNGFFLLPDPRTCLGHPASGISKKLFGAFGLKNVFLVIFVSLILAQISGFGENLAKFSDFGENVGSGYENLSFGQA